MKILATHHNPHLDDVCGIWLLNRFHPSYKRAKVAFINQASKIDEEKYMFYEWKSGDYIYGNKNPGYYILKQI